MIDPTTQILLLHWVLGRVVIRHTGIYFSALFHKVALSPVSLVAWIINCFPFGNSFTGIMLCFPPDGFQSFLRPF